MDPNNFIDIYNALPENTKEVLLNPTAQSIGDAMGGAVKFILTPFKMLGIISDHAYNDFKTIINNKSKEVPLDNRDPSKLGLVLKAIEESRYQLNEDLLREIYANLVVSSVDNRKNNKITPRYATALSQLGVDDVRFLQKLYFAESHNFPCGRLISKHDDGSVILTEPAYYPTNGSIAVRIAETLDILESLGLIKVFFDTWLSNDIYLQKYSDIEGFLKKLHPSFLADNVELEKGYIKLSDFGRSLCSCIFE